MLAPEASTVSPKVGGHVFYIKGKPGERTERQDALIQVVFAMNGGLPYLTLVTIQPGERGICYRIRIPHKSRYTDEKGYYLLPTDLWP